MPDRSISLPVAHLSSEDKERVFDWLAESVHADERLADVGVSLDGDSIIVEWSEP